MNLNRLKRLLNTRPPARPARPQQPTLDAAGGFWPRDLSAGRTADFITLPEGVKGTNCLNCLYATPENSSLESNIAFCQHPKIRQYVTDRNCCAYWDNIKVERPASYHHVFPKLRSSVVPPGK